MRSPGSPEALAMRKEKVKSTGENKQKPRCCCTRKGRGETPTGVCGAAATAGSPPPGSGRGSRCKRPQNIWWRLLAQIPGDPGYSRGFLAVVLGSGRAGWRGKEGGVLSPPLVPFIRDALPAAEDSLCVESPDPPTHAGAGGPGIPGGWPPSKPLAVSPFFFRLPLLIRDAPLPHPFCMEPVPCGET